jgi:hypothetical protein
MPASRPMMLPMALLVATAPSASDGYFELVGVQLLVLSAATANVTDHDVTGLLIELETRALRAAGMSTRVGANPAVSPRARPRVDQP